MVCRVALRLSLLMVLVAAGCEVHSASQPAPSGRVLDGPVGAQQAAPIPGGPAAAPAGQSLPNAVARQPAAGAPGAGFPIRLSAGTALPQTGPDGTLMGFSVDYQVTADQFPAKARCVLVISRRDGKQVEQPVNFSGERTWMLLVPGWEPDGGPFAAQVEEIEEGGGRRALSATVPLL